MRKLRAARVRQGLTLAQLSERTGVAISTISAAETGAHIPLPLTLAKLAEGLGVPVETFLEEVEAPRPLAGSTSASG